MIPSRATRCLLAGAALVATQAASYPIDGYPDTGIRRLEAARLAEAGELRDVRQPAGALLTTGAVDLRLLDRIDLELPAPDAAFSADVVTLLGADADRYGVSVLDLSDPTRPHYAEHRGDYRQNVGSVGKLVVAIALFQALADTWPEAAQRAALLRTTTVTADAFAHWDHHTVRRYDPFTRSLVRRPVQDGDEGSLFEWLDWMLSVSSNSAAAIVMREAMLLRAFGARYPVEEADATEFFGASSRSQQVELFARTFVEPMVRNGIDAQQLQQGSLFTAEGKRIVRGVGSSYGTARELTRMMLRLEQGRIVDAWSSRQLKRLLYMTERRIRYASSPALTDAAVYFKSGSLYSCRPEPDFHCGPYRGNVRNYMNSVAIVESPAGSPSLHYVVTVISDVLRRNSAVEHQRLASGVHRLIADRHAQP